MDRSPQQIVRGQVWQRKKDGVLVVVKNYRADWDDCAWEGVEDRKKKGSCYGWTLRHTYELVEDGMTRRDIEWERFRKQNAAPDPAETFRAGYEAGRLAPR